jgi:glutathionylspermidine synthase
MTSAPSAPSASYDAFAKRISASGIVTDPWLSGEPRFREEPVLVSSSEARDMYRVAESVAEVYNELCLMVADEPEALDTFFGLSPYQKAMWLASQPLWHVIARADVFVTDEGLQIAELNCDTPTGEAEAVVLNALVAGEHAHARDPNTELGERFCAMVDALRVHLIDGDAPRTIGLVYPTEFTEDLSLVRLYRRWFEERGYRVVLGSPYNLDGDESGVHLFDTPVSVVLRHYKTDWWSERSAAWDDDPILDARALEEPLAAVFAAMLARKVVVVNPFGAVLPQNKRMMAFMWEHLHRFSPHAQDVIQKYVPVSSRLENVHEEQLLVEKRDWVIKSDYGAEGDEVIIGRDATDEEWRLTLQHARPGRWIAQRYFAAEENELGEAVNYGVFLVAGEASGLYARVQAGPTDDRALSAPALIIE